MASTVGAINWPETTTSHPVHAIRAALRDQLTSLGWSERVRIRSSYGITITAMNRRMGLCVQTGNIARFYADLMKLQLAFLDDLVNGALYIVPTNKAAQEMGSNMVNYERVVAEARLFAKIITLPLIIFGFENEEGA
jgi:hypothetical protein